MNIQKGTKKNKKKAKKRRAGEVANEKNSNNKNNSQDNGAASKRVHFDLSQNKVTEFFKHGKVA